MGKLTDIQIRAWIKNGERFEGRADGDGLYLRFREGDASASWRYRYRFDGKQRVMNLGGYGTVSLAKARETAKSLAAKVALGHDVAGEKQDRKREAVAKIEAEMQVAQKENERRIVEAKTKREAVIAEVSLEQSAQLGVQWLVDGRDQAGEGTCPHQVGGCTLPYGPN